MILINTSASGGGGDSGITISTTAITGGTAGRLLFEGAGNVVSQDADLTFSGDTLTATKVATTVATITGGTVTTSTSPISVTQTWNDAGVAFSGIKLNITNTASSASSKFIDIQKDGNPIFSLHNGTFGGTNLGGHGIVIGDPNVGAACTITSGRADSPLYLGITQQFGLDMRIVSPWLQFRNAYELRWSDDNTSYGTTDFGIARLGAASGKITDGEAGTGKLTFNLDNAATTGLTAGVLAATTNATVTLTDSTGQVYRIPCII